MKKLIVLMLSLLLLTGILVGCGNSNLPVKNIRFEPDQDGFLQFYTNDENYYGYISRIIYKLVDPENPDIIPPFNNAEIEMKKLSGNANVPYGLLFCAKDEYSFYLIIIDTNQNYIVYKFLGKDIEAERIISKTKSNNLKPGYNTSNIIRVSQSQEEPGKFSIYFNGNFETSFTNNDTTYNKCGTFGLFTFIGEEDEESFPNTPIDIRFKILNPLPKPQLKLQQQFKIEQTTSISEIYFSQNLAK